MCNPFLILGGEEPQGVPRRLYAVLDQAEPADEGIHRLLFGGVDADWFDERLQDLRDLAVAQNFAAIFNPMPLYLLELDLSTESLLGVGRRRHAPKPLGPEDQKFAGGERLPPRLFRTIESLERRWMALVLGEGGAAGKLYKNLFGAPSNVAIAAAEDPPVRARQVLNQIDPLKAEPDAAEADIRSGLSSIIGNAVVDHLAVYDVGQGGANGLITGGKVVAYFDFGGGVAGHTSTFPNALKNFCFCNTSPPIILSHWDHDHWSAQGRDVRAHATTWVVPRQTTRSVKIAQHHQALVTTIRQAGGKVLVWPAGLRSVSLGQCRILKCKGRSKNASGLALEVDPPSGQSGSPMLMPADAGYDDLPVQASRYDAIVCPHHGGLSNSPTIPTRPSNAHSRLAYSYGLPNSYGHPLPATCQAHDTARWFDPRAGSPSPGEVRNTVDRGAARLGHIGYNWGSSATPPALPCGGNCQLGIQQF